MAQVRKRKARLSGSSWREIRREIGPTAVAEFDAWYDRWVVRDRLGMMWFILPPTEATDFSVTWVDEEYTE